MGRPPRLLQAEIAAKLGILPSVVSRAMGLLVERGLVLRRGNRYALNPAIAGYSSETELRDELGKAVQQGLPPIHVPEYASRPPKTGKGGLQVA